jgi:hypothetical protein
MAVAMRQTTRRLKPAPPTRIGILPVLVVFPVGGNALMFSASQLSPTTGLEKTYRLGFMG